MNIIRQGDVLLVQVSALPNGVSEVPLENGRIVLMHGEVTGHAHAIQQSPAEIVNRAIARARLYALADGTRYLDVQESVEMRHEEHTHHMILPGIYELPIQVDMTTDKMPRRVAD